MQGNNAVNMLACNGSVWPLQKVLVKFTQGSCYLPATCIYIHREVILEMRQPAARILIADDHQLLADACKGLLEPEFAVVGIVVDGRALIDAAFTLKPDVIILDIGMPMLNGLVAAERIKREMPKTRLVFLFRMSMK